MADEKIMTVVTDYRREMLCKITSGAVDTIPKITHTAFGSGGADCAPAGTQTALNQEEGRYEIDSVTYPKPTTARYTVTIPEDDLAGVSISEAALVDESGGLCAIRHMLPKGKDTGVTFIFTFDDEF